MKKMEVTIKDKIRGSLIGGAIGDALGYAVEFISLRNIKEIYGEKGIRRYILNYDGVAEISDDTQMTLFTANGLLYGDTRLCMRGIMGNLHDYVREAYKEWYQTQTTIPRDDTFHTCWIRDLKVLNSRRAPGVTCMNALQDISAGHSAHNNSKGCGGVMRVSPVGLMSAAMNSNGAKCNLEQVIGLGAECAAITHQHPLGWIPAGILSGIIFEITSFTEQTLDSADLEKVIINVCDTAQNCFNQKDDVLKQREMIINAINLAKNNESDETNIKHIGEGWTGDEALCIAIYCAIRHINSFEDAIVAAVNHDGDSDSTGSICGNIIGALYGYEDLPDHYKQNLELADVILTMADDLASGCNISEYGTNDKPEQLQWMARYVYAYPHGFPYLETVTHKVCYVLPGVFENDIENITPENLHIKYKNFFPDFVFLGDDNHTSKDDYLDIWYQCDMEVEGVKYHSVGEFMNSERKRISTEWSHICYAVCLYGNYHKFQQNEECRQALLQTKDWILANQNDDELLGIGCCHDVKCNIQSWTGKNYIGLALMHVRMLLGMRTPKYSSPWCHEFEFSEEDQKRIDEIPDQKQKFEYKQQLIDQKKFKIVEKWGRTESGTFKKKGGNLVEFVPSEDNIVGTKDGRTVLRSIIFPREHIDSIADGMFCDLEVTEAVELPDTLKSIGSGDVLAKGCFVNCILPTLKIPKSTAHIGVFSFAKCQIETLYLCKGSMFCDYGRQFKGADIQNLILRGISLTTDEKLGLLNSIKSNAHAETVYLNNYIKVSWNEFR